MSPVDDRPDAAVAGETGTAARLAALERQVAALAAEVAQLRPSAAPRDPSRAPPELVDFLRAPPQSAPHSAPQGNPFARARAAMDGATSGLELESLVGRYGTLLLAALVILMGVGVLIKVAVSRGLLTPEVRIGSGALVAAVVGAVGVRFHRRGEVRYGNVLLALALAIVDLVAWGAGPQLHLVPIGVALMVVDVVAIALAALALHDGSEFLFCIAVAGALSSPFVTSEGGGSAPALLTYGAAVLIGSLSAARDPRWVRAFAVLAGGALVYALAAAAMATSAAWYGPFAVMLFGAVSALAALLLAEPEWRGGLSRAFLAVALVGVPAGWDRIANGEARVAWLVALGVAAVTYAALAIRRPRQAWWRASALLLPLGSLAIASAVTQGREPAQGVVFATWTVFALGAWRFERLRSELRRGGVQLLAGGVLGSLAVALLLWKNPFALAAGLAAWGVVVTALVAEESTVLPLLGAVVALGGAALSALDQLASRPDYSYTPFATRSSASALCATIGLALAGLVLGRAKGVPATWADRAVRLGALIGFAILWGRMEVAGAYSRDLATFLLIAYYAACGVGSIVVGRTLAIQRLRVAGLTLAIYAAVKAVMHASEIGGLLLRVGAYGAVGVFLLGAGYLYRERASEAWPAEQGR
ncbi:MAG: hypothetical protein ACHQRK_03915 [Gemmatimonadales bacterium]